MPFLPQPLGRFANIKGGQRCTQGRKQPKATLTDAAHAIPQQGKQMGRMPRGQRTQHANAQPNQQGIFDQPGQSRQGMTMLLMQGGQHTRQADCAN